MSNIQNLDHTQIVYMQSDTNYTNIFTLSGRIYSSYTLKHLEARLMAGSFLRIHRGLAVNKQHIIGIDGDRYFPHLQLFGGCILPISRRRYSDIKELFKTCS